MTFNLMWKYLDTPTTSRNANASFNEMFYRGRKPLSPAHIHLSVGKTFCQIDRVEEGLKSLVTAGELFLELQSTNGKALADLQIVLFDKARMVDPIRTCGELRNLANIFIKCEDWIATNSAMAELSEMLQCGPLSMQPRFQDCQLEIKNIYEHTKNNFSFWQMQSQVWMLEFTKPTSFGKGIEMCTAFFNDNPACSIRLYKESFATMLQIAYEGIGDDSEATKWAELCLKLTEEVGDRGLIIANKASLARLQRKLWKSKSQGDVTQGMHYLEALFDEGSGGANGIRITEPHILVTLAVYLADLWVARSDAQMSQGAETADCLSQAMRWIQLGRNILPDVQEDNKSSSRAALSFVEATILQRMDMVEETVNLCEALLSAEQGTLWPQDKANIQHLFATTLSVQSLRALTNESFTKAKGMYLQAITTATELGDTFKTVQYLNALVHMCCIWRRSSVENPFTASEVLRWIKQWEEIWEEIRSEASVLRGLKGLQVRQRIRERNSVALYMAAIELCIEQDNIPEAWEWVQKAKARAVTDSLGLSNVVPFHLSQGLSEESAHLLQREQALLDIIKTSPVPLTYETSQTPQRNVHETRLACYSSNTTR